MNTFSPIVVYPTDFDRIDYSNCEYCTFECDIHGYCHNEED